MIAHTQSIGINPVRGDVAFSAGGQTFCLRLTFGALAEIGAGLGVSTLAELGARLGSGDPADLCLVLDALLRGGREQGACPVLPPDIDAHNAGVAILAAFAPLLAIGEAAR